MARVDNTGGSGFTTDNGTGLVVRTKLNQIIAALSTNNQGSGAVSYTHLTLPTIYSV